MRLGGSANARSFGFSASSPIPTSGGPAEPGPNLVTNGTFTGNADDWALENAVYDANTALFDDASPVGSYIEQVISLSEGSTYEAKFTIADYLGGEVCYNVGGTTGMARAAAGTFTQNIIAGASDWIRVEGIDGANLALRVDDVELRLLS